MNPRNTTSDALDGERPATRAEQKAARKAEKKAEKARRPPKLPWCAIGDQQRGLVSNARGGQKIEYHIKDHHTGRQKVELDPVTTTVRIETADEATKHMKGGRIGGGAVVGGILLGPLGAVVGGGIGAAARKSYTDKYLTLEAEDGKAYSVLLKGRIEYASAQDFQRAVLDIQRYAAREQRD